MEPSQPLGTEVEPGTGTPLLLRCRGARDVGVQHKATHPSALQLQPCRGPGLGPQGIAQHLLVALQEAFGALWREARPILVTGQDPQGQAGLWMGDMPACGWGTCQGTAGAHPHAAGTEKTWQRSVSYSAQHASPENQGTQSGLKPAPLLSTC